MEGSAVRLAATLAYVRNVAELRTPSPRTTLPNAMIRHIRTALALFIASTALLANAQYTDRAAMNDLGGPKEFAARRTELAAKLKTGYVLLFAKTQEPAADHYREDNDFYYYTGLSDPGAIMLMDVATQRTTIFEPQQSPREVQVYGANLLSMSKDEQKELGYPAVAPLAGLDGYLSFLFGGGVDNDLWVRLGFADKPDGARFETGRDYAAEYNNPYGQNLPGDRDALVKLRERYPAANFRNITGAMDAMRNIKRPGEIEVLRRNGRISAQGDEQAIRMAHPGMYEYQIEAEAAFVFRNSGAQGLAYPAIVGSGVNANTWHYFFNRNKIEPGERCGLRLRRRPRPHDHGHHSHLQHRRQIHARAGQMVQRRSRMPEGRDRHAQARQHLRAGPGAGQESFRPRGRWRRNGTVGRVTSLASRRTMS